MSAEALIVIEISSNVALSRVFISSCEIATEEYKDPLLGSTYSYNIERETSRQQKRD